MSNIKKKMTPEELKAFRVANLAKGRAKRKANLEAQKEAISPEKEVSANVETATKEDVQKAVLDAVKEMRAEPAILQPQPDYTDAPVETGDEVAKSQADYIPGTRRFDGLAVPDYVFDEGTNSRRRCGLPQHYKYCWVEQGKLNWFKTSGYRFCYYNGGPNSGLAEGGFKGTFMYERTLDNHVRNGDVLLMWTHLRNWEALQEEERKQIDTWNAAAETDLADRGYRHGVRTFKEVDGQQEFN
jgi:hypothetical protein